MEMFIMGFPDNPKRIQALKDGKAPMDYLVPSVLESDARVHKHGADKYGKLNWRLDPILSSTYVAAILRHWKSWAEGEDIDPESGEPHLTHIRACCAVVLDSQKYGTLIDDRLKMESKNDKDSNESEIISPKEICESKRTSRTTTP